MAETVELSLRAELEETKLELLSAQARLHQAQEELERAKVQLSQYERDLQQTTAVLQQVQAQQQQVQYQQLMAQALKAYQVGDLAMMLQCLEQTLDLPWQSDVLVAEWLRFLHGSYVADASRLDILNLVNSAEWRALTRKLVDLKG